MKTKIAALAAVGGALTLTAIPTSAQAWYDCHCHYSVATHHVVGYKPVYYRAVYYKPIFAHIRPYHCFCYSYHHVINPYAPYPNVFVENAHVYVPPDYYYAPYSYVDHVLVHRSVEIGPVVPVVAPKPVITVLGVTVL